MTGEEYGELLRSLDRDVLTEFMETLGYFGPVVEVDQAGAERVIRAICGIGHAINIYRGLKEAEQLYLPLTPTSVIKDCEKLEQSANEIIRIFKRFTGVDPCLIGTEAKSALSKYVNEKYGIVIPEDCIEDDEQILFKILQNCISAARFEITRRKKDLRSGRRGTYHVNEVYLSLTLDNFEKNCAWGRGDTPDLDRRDLRNEIVRCLELSFGFLGVSPPSQVEKFLVASADENSLFKIKAPKAYRRKR